MPKQNKEPGAVTCNKRKQAAGLIVNRKITAAVTESQPNGKSKNFLRKSVRYSGKSKSQNLDSKRIGGAFNVTPVAPKLTIQTKNSENEKVKYILCDPAIVSIGPYCPRVDVDDDASLFAKLRNVLGIRLKCASMLTKLRKLLGIRLKCDDRYFDITDVHNNSRYKLEDIPNIVEKIDQPGVFHIDEKLFNYLRLNRHSKYENQSVKLEHYTSLAKRYVATTSNAISLTTEQAGIFRYTIAKAAADRTDEVLNSLASRGEIASNKPAKSPYFLYLLFLMILLFLLFNRTPNVVEMFIMNAKDRLIGNPGLSTS